MTSFLLIPIRKIRIKKKPYRVLCDNIALFLLYEYDYYYKLT